MTDPLTTQLQSSATVPPSKRPRLDSIGDGTDFFLEDLPDDLLVTNIDLPALDGPSATELPGIPAGSQPPGLNSTPANTSQGRSVAQSVSPLAQPLSQQQSPATSMSPNPKPTPTPPQSGAAMLNSGSPRMGAGGGGGATTSVAGAPPNTTVVSTSADPTPTLPNISSTSTTATPYPNMATPPSSVSLAMAATHPRMPSVSYNSYHVGGVTSSAPAINSQMGMQPQQPGMGSYSLRHPAPSPGMGGHVMQAQMVHSPNMMAGQHRIMPMRHRAMIHQVHGAPPSMMSGHPQQSMGMHHPHMATIHRGAPGQQMAPAGVNMGGGGIVQQGAGMHMNPNLHMAYDPRTRMAMMAKSGMHHQRMVGPPHMQQHPAMHPQRAQSVMIGGHPHQYMDPSSYQGHMRGGYSMVPGQNAILPPHSHHQPSSQMMAHPNQHILQQQQQQQQQQQPPQMQPSNQPQQSLPQSPRPPSEGVGQGSPLPGQLGGAPGPQLQITTPPQSQAAPPQQPAPGAAPLSSQQTPPTSRPATPQQQQQLQHQLSAPPTSAPMQRGSPVGTAAMQPATGGATPSSQSGPAQQQTPPTQQLVGSAAPQTQAQPPMLPPHSSIGQQPTSLPPHSSSSLPLPTDSLPYFHGGRGGMSGPMGHSPHGVGGGVNTFGAPPTSAGYVAGMGGANQQATTDPEKRKLIQQQLVLLLHAHKCQRREREQSMGGGREEYQPCSLPHCQTMKKVLDHMTECQAGRQCTYAHCASSRQIITHWKNCRKPDCSVCQPLRITALPRKREDNQVMRPPLQAGVNSPYSQPPAGSPQMVQPPRPLGPAGAPPNHTIRPHDPMMMSSGGRPAGLDSVFDPGALGDMAGLDMTSQSRVPFPVSIPSIPNQQTQAWHQSVQPELRQHLVRKLVETIFPIQNPHALQDQRVNSLIQYAMKVEKAMFEMATSREAYYQLLAEKIYRIRKELEERKKMRMEMEKQRRPMGEGVGVDGHIPNGGDGLGPGFFGSNQRHPMAPSPFSSQSPFPAGHANSPGSQSSVADGNPSSLPPIDFLTATEDKKEGLLPPSSSSSSSVGGKPFSPRPPSLPDLDNIKSEVKSELKSPPPSIRPPWSRPEAPPSTQPATPSEQKPILSVPRAPTPREPVSSVKSRTGGENPPDSVPPSLPPSVPPATPSKMETGSAPSAGKHKVVPDPTLRKFFLREELLEALMPVLEMVYKQEPESRPFWDPVDPNRLGIPDYFDIIKNPMDLRTIRNKLEEGHFSNPWEFCSDMRLMFDNAWVYNKKTSRVYKYCTKLAEVFDDCINSAMVKLGYCCGGRHTFHPQVLYCYGKSLCTIARDSIYYSYQNRYIYCQKCFSELPGDTVAVGDDPTNTSEVAKTMFNEKKNDHVDYEPVVKCIHCGREFHSICVLYHPAIWGGGYQCDGCLKAKGTSRRENKFCARRLPTNKLSNFLEERVNMFLRSSDSGAEVIIRTVSSFDKVLDTRPLMKDRFPGDFPEQFPYRTKALFAFEEIDGCEVCFFGLHVQEYGSDCAAPNTRRVYISYLDSIHFFHPKHLRTLVYHEILIGYLQFCKQNGFMTAHIWACPPSEGDDYIFHCHPVEQKIPKPKRLVEWYRKMLDRGKADNVVYDYRDIFKHCTDESVTSVTEIPYFEGDFWPNIIEDTIKELDQEAREREASEAATVEGRGTKKAGKRGTNKKGSKKASGARSKSGKASGIMMRGDNLSQKIYTTMDKHKEVFFVVLLQPPAVCNSPIGSTVDPDQLIPCDLMDGRDAFLTMARERHWEFSSLRRAKASSQAMLYELHNQGTSFIYSCNSCGRSVETRYHCRECDDFDLCLACYDTTKHEHPMERLGLGMMDPGDQGSVAEKDPQARWNASLKRAIESLIHASQCRNPQCKLPSCITIKRVLRHTQMCRMRNTSSHCQICKQFLFIVYSHAKTCKNNNCPLGGMCKKIKQNIQETRAQERRRSNLLMQKRIRNMQGMSLGTSSNGSSDSPAPTNSSPPTNKAPPPTPPQKGSPTILSPAGPRSVGKGGPRTPAGAMAGGKGANSKMMAHVGPAGSKPDQPMPAPNVTVNQLTMGGEAIIHKVPQQSMMAPDHEVQNNMMALYRQRQGGVISAEMTPHQQMYASQRSAPMSMMGMRTSAPPPGGYSQTHPQLMRAAPAQQYTPQMPSFRTAYPQSVHHMVGPAGPAQVYSQQTHQSPQLSRMLSQRPPTVQTYQYQTPPNAYSQMPPQPMGPPPQYVARVPQQQQTVGYPHMLGHPHHQQMHGPMSQPIPTSHAHQFGATPQSMQMEHGVQGDPNFVYNGSQQQTYQLNTNNSNNLSQAAYLTPAERLSSLSELL